MERERFFVDGLVNVITDTNATQKRIKHGLERRYYQLVYNVSGEAVTHYDGKVLRNSAGTVELLPPARDREVEYYVDYLQFGRSIVVFFDTHYALPTEAQVIDCRENKKLGPLFEKIYTLWTRKPDGYYYECMACFYTIIATLSAPVGHYLPRDKYHKIEAGIAYLHEHYTDKKVDYYMPAQLCGISYTYFKRLFMQKFEMTPIQYVASLRMERSVEYLLTNRYSVTEIANLCGYEDVYYFSKKFKEKYGVSPKNYKQDRALGT